MSKRIYTKAEMVLLEKNEHVLKVSEKSITYKSEFKIKAVKQNKEGIGPQNIFINAGFNLNIIGLSMPKQCLRRWRKTYNEFGEDGLKNETRGRQTGSKRGRPTNKDITPEEETRRLKAKIAYLEAENELLKKLNELEASVMKK